MTKADSPIELIPRDVRVAVIEAAGGWCNYTLREIADLFESQSFTETAFEPEGSGVRRQLVRAYQEMIDFTDGEQAERYLRLIEVIVDNEEGVENDEIEFLLARFMKALRRADIERDARGHFQLPRRGRVTVPLLADAPDESGIRLHLERLERLEQEPEEMIGAAKELVEATAKHVLLELGEEVPATADLPALSKLALKKLKLHPEGVAPTAKGAEVMMRVLGSLGQAAGGLAELRNLGYGTGHGAGRRIKGIKRRHAEFAARAAIAFTTFVLDTLNDQDAPWRKATRDADV